MWAGTNASIPAGWERETGMDTKYPKGSAASTNPNQTGGSNSHSHTSSGHTHAMNSHSHSVYLGNSDENFGCDPGGSGIPLHEHKSFTITGPSGGTLQSTSPSWQSVNQEPPYYTLIYVKPSNARAPIKDGLIALWGENSTPDGYYFCNGANSTPDLRNKYPKGAAVGGNAGTTGGSLNHGHNIGHTHTSSSHTHSGTSSAAYTVHGDRQSFFSLQEAARLNHTHPITLNAATQAINSYTNTTAGNSDSVEPAYKKLVPLQADGDKGNPVEGLIGMWLGDLDDIPLGWYLCDGDNGTPDMRSKFLKFANATSEAGDTGGSNTHQHSSVSHTHTASGTHSHSVSHGIESSWGSRNGGGGDGYAPYGHNHAGKTCSSVAPTYANANVSCNSSNNEPAYRTVAFVQFAFAANAGVLAMMI